MPYPISISKEMDITFQNVSLEQIIDLFASELENQYESSIMIKGQCINILESESFFSSKSSLRHLNKGKISFTTKDSKLKIKGHLLLIEHLIIFSAIILATMGLYFSGQIKSNTGLTVAVILLVVSFLFLYLFPMITFSSFFTNAIKRIEKNCNNLTVK